MLTPADIHNKEFKHGFRGYDEDEVDTFLDDVISDFESLEHENIQLKEELALEKKKLEQLQQMEKNLQDTLLVAQKTADEVIRNAKVRAEEMRQAAEEDCNRLRQQTEADLSKHLEEMRAQVREEEERYDSIRQSQRQFLIKIKSLLRTELELLDEDGVQKALEAPLKPAVAENSSPITEDTIVMTPKSTHRNAEGEVIRDARILAEQRREQAAAGAVGEGS